MRRGEIGGCDFGSGLVRFQRLVGGSLALIGHGELGEITVVVTLPVVQVSEAGFDL